MSVVTTKDRAAQMRLLEEQICGGDYRIRVDKSKARNAAAQRERRLVYRLVAEAKEWRGEGALEMVGLCLRQIRRSRIKARLYALGVTWPEIAAEVQSGVRWSEVEGKLRPGRREAT